MAAKLVACCALALALQGCSEDPHNPDPPATASVTLRNGVRMPMLAAGGAFYIFQLILRGLRRAGTWQYNDSVAEDAVLAAIQAGFEHIDTAYDYDNQAENMSCHELPSVSLVEVGVGRALKKSGKARSKLFITSKVGPESRLKRIKTES